jgi:hypothetical protein
MGFYRWRTNKYFIGYNESSKITITTSDEVCVGVTSPRNSRLFDVNGKAGGNEVWDGTSDRRLKKSIKQFQMLSKK